MNSTTQFPAKKKGRPSIRPDAEKLSELYQEHTAKEIANMYHVNVSTVFRWIQKYRKG